MRIRYGSGNSELPDYIKEQVGENVSCARGLTSVFLEHPSLGNSPWLQPWSFLCKRTLRLDDGSDQWYLAKANIGTGYAGLNPAHIIRECFTNTRWGLGYDESLFDETLWQGLADTLYSEGFALSRLWEDEKETIEELIIDIVRHINGVLYQDPHSGEFILKLIRDDYVLDDLEVFDESDIMSLDEFERPSLGEVPNVFKANITNVYLNKNVTLIDHDIALINQQNGKRIPVEYDFMAITSHYLGRKVLARERMAIASMPATMTLRCKRTMAHLRPGDVFKLVAPSHDITQMIVRILPDAKYGTLEDGRVTFKVSEDVFSVEESIIGESDTEWAEVFEDPEDAQSLLMESPYWWLVNLLGETAISVLDQDAGFFTLAAKDPSTSTGYELLVRADVSESYASQGLYGFSFVGTLLTDMPLNAEDIVLTFAEDLENVGVGSIAVVGNEILKVLDVSTDSSGIETITLARGCLDTVPEFHVGESTGTEGAIVWFLDDATSFNSPFELTYGDQPGAKVLTRTGSDQLDEEDATAVNASVFNARQIRPYPPGNFKINGVSYPSKFYGTSVTISWAHRDRLQQITTIAEHSDGDIGPEAGVTYTLEIYDDVDTLLRQVTGISDTSYVYTQAMEYSDRGTAGLSSSLRFVLYAVRTGYTGEGSDSSGTIESWQKYDITVLRGNIYLMGEINVHVSVADAELTVT
jgi:hypothetical protein